LDDRYHASAFDIEQYYYKKEKWTKSPAVGELEFTEAFIESLGIKG